MRNRYSLFCLLIMTVILSSCWDVEEADQMDYAHGLAIDYKDGEIVVHLQLVNLGTLGTPDTAASEEPKTVVATATATNLNEAIFDIYRSSQRRIYWGHATFILLSEAALEQSKLSEVLDLITRFSQTRYRIQVYATNSENLLGILESIPVFEGSAIFTKMTDKNNSYPQNTFVEQVTIRELLIMLDEPGYNGIFPVVKLNEDSWVSKQKPHPMIEVTGVASVKEDGFQGFLLEDDINGLRWVQKDSIRNDLTIDQEGKPAAELVIVEPKAKFKIDMKGDKPTFHVSISAKGMINAVLQKLDQEKIMKETEKKVKEEVLSTYKKALEKEIDIYRLSEKLYRKHLHIWQKIEKDGMIPLEENSLKVEVNIDLGDAKLNKTEPILK